MYTSFVLLEKNEPGKLKNLLKSDLAEIIVLFRNGKQYMHFGRGLI